MSSRALLAPVFFVSHGGGPCWFMKRAGGLMGQMDSGSPAAAFLRRAHEDVLVKQGGLIGKPRGIVVVSAHWEADGPVRITSAPDPGLLYDYYGFPPETYAPHLTYPAKTDAELVERTAAVLQAAGIPAVKDAKRAFDHGMFIPLKLIYPDADVPVVQVSLSAKLDPGFHIDLGRALAPLRSEGYLIVGSGEPTHNLRAGLDVTPPPGWATEFVEWLEQTLTSPDLSAEQRLDALRNWAKATPHARQAHPREEHLVPIFVCAGAAWPDTSADAQPAGPATCVYGSWAGHLSLHHFLFV